MTIAKVIVDVPAKMTDKPFDYLIPESLQGCVVPGMRVVVPFGPRRVQGFVLAIETESSFDKLREIIEPMDIEPVLNKELLHLSDWLTEKTLCYKISAFQVMLPPALKAKYEKKIKLKDQSNIDELSEVIRPCFYEKKVLNWDEVLQTGHLAAFQKEAAAGKLEVLYEVKERIRKKQIKVITPIGSPEFSLLRGSKQKLVMEYFAANPEPIERNQLLNQLNVSAAVLKGLLEKGLLKESRREVYRDPFADRIIRHTKPLALTNEQSAAIKPILSSIIAKKHEVFLLYGVTGSGKTEVYLQSIQKVLEEGREGIVLVPEISLTPQMVNRFKSRFGDQVAVLHSGLSIGEKYDEWRKIQRKEVKVVVGARSAVFAPFENLGIIIIDEEHETSYKQEDNPRYHARDVAIERGIRHQCPVILGSATPSLESFARAKKGVYSLLTLSKRMNEHDLPEVQIVDMREELREGNRSMFSQILYEKIQERLAKKEQIVLFLNKRGHSSFVMCRDCGYVIQCPNCDISLTYHRSSQQMKCHYCGYEASVPRICPECASEHIRYFGTGTQKVEEELGKIFPGARVIRMDVDTTSRKGAHEKLLSAFHEGKADILLGTQMIAKGLDFPNITLVGVLSADTMLHLPDFRSSEKTFQLLTQVSGRAGRHELAGEVIIQTYSPEHYSIELAGEQDYDKFYSKEMMIRKIHQYPPFYYLALITVNHEDLMKAVAAVEKITRFLHSRLSQNALILGPVASPIPRINNKYRYQCLIKYKQESRLTETLKEILEHYGNDARTNGLQVSIDTNPFILM
nr:primosomal protein N' [uncultured Bacillus sp.]